MTPNCIQQNMRNTFHAIEFNNIMNIIKNLYSLLNITFRNNILQPASTYSKTLPQQKQFE